MEEDKINDVTEDTGTTVSESEVKSHEELKIEDPVVIDEPKVEEKLKKKRAYKKRAKKEKVRVEVKAHEELKIEEPVVEEKAPTSPDYEYTPWWNEVGSVLAMRGYSAVGIVNRAVRAYGKNFSPSRYNDYIANNSITFMIEKVKAVWKSQK